MHELETKGKFDKNDKLSFVSDDMLILGCDIGSETHYVRAIDTRGRELSKSAFCFSNTADGFESMLDWSTKLAAANDKKQIWHEAKLRGRGYANASSILEYVRKSVGIKDGADAGRQAVKWFVSRIIELDEQLSDIENQLNQRCNEIPYAKNILAISGIGENILSGILAEMGDISRFDNVKEIQKLSGLGLVACRSGKHTGETKISHRGRKRLRI